MKKFLVAFVLLNIAGLFVALHAVVRISALAKQEQRADYDAVDGISFFCSAGPILLVCLLLNLGWGFKAARDIFRRRDYSALATLFIAAMAWMAQVLVSRHWITPLHPPSIAVHQHR